MPLAPETTAPALSPGRPRVVKGGRSASIYLPEALWRRLCRLAEQREISRSHLLREIVERELADQ